MLKQVKKRTTSLWSYTNHSANISEFLNPVFDYGDLRQFLPAEWVPSRLLFWASLYCRYEVVMSPTVTFQNKVRMLKEQTTKLAQEIKTLTIQHNELKIKYQQLETAYREALHNPPQSHSLVTLNSTSVSAPPSVSSLSPSSNEEM
jgi:hypothetical protein